MEVEKDFMKEVDDLILHASPNIQEKLANLDISTQLSKLTFYDVYAELSDSEKTRLMLDV